MERVDEGAAGVLEAFFVAVKIGSKDLMHCVLVSGWLSLMWLRPDLTCTPSTCTVARP